jgi:hypothetical protein
MSRKTAQTTIFGSNFTDTQILAVMSCSDVWGSRPQERCNLFIAFLISRGLAASVLPITTVERSVELPLSDSRLRR